MSQSKTPEIPGGAIIEAPDEMSVSDLLSRIEARLDQMNAKVLDERQKATESNAN